MWWQSKEFKEMLDYEREHCREKFVYDVNNLLGIYELFLIEENPMKAYERYGENLIELLDPQLVSMVFASISIIACKDSVDFKSRDPYELMQLMQDRMKHSMHLPIKKLQVGESFEIPASTFDPVHSTYNIDEWEFEFDESKVEVDGNKVTALKNGDSIVECINKNTGAIKRVKINGGNTRESNIGEFFFMQLRNIIAHGRYTISNSGLYDTLQEYGFYNMRAFDNRYSKGTWRNLYLYDGNQLNVTYGSENTVNPIYFEEIAKDVYDPTGANKFIPFIDLIKTTAEIISPRVRPKLTESQKVDFKALILLSKFYTNFMYNYDSLEKATFDYDLLIIPNTEGKKNAEYIYEIRTAIAHGRYEYDENGFHFWNTDKKDHSKISFDTRISNNNFALLIKQKEDKLIENMSYNPEQLKPAHKRV